LAGDSWAHSCLCKLSAGLQGSFRRTCLCLVKSRFPTAETDFGRDSVHRKSFLSRHMGGVAPSRPDSPRATLQRSVRLLGGLLTIRPSAAWAAWAASAASAASAGYCAACVASADCAASVAACPLGKLYAGTMCSGVFVVEDIESRQADVRNFFFTKSNYRCRVLRRRIAWRTNGCPGCARQRQRPSDSQYRYGFRPTPSLRSCFACDIVETSHIKLDGCGCPYRKSNSNVLMV